MRVFFAFVCSVVVLSACAGKVTDPDAGMTSDAGVTSDGGVTSDAGATDAGGTDAGAPQDGGGVCPASALLCESFETGLDAARWQVNGDAAAFTIDETMPAADGRKSLHLSFGAPRGHTGQQSVELLTPPAAPDDRMYLRVFLRFGDLSLPGAHPSFVDVTDDAKEVGFGSIINDWAMMAWGFGPGGLDDARTWYEGGSWHAGVEDGDATPTSEMGLQANTWICFEAMYFGDHQGAGDTAHPDEQVTVWLDGVEVPDLNLSDALWTATRGSPPPEHWSPKYDHAKWRFGVESFGPENVNLDLWFDGLAFSHTRIGCR
jgi:hypothetical protein